MLMYVKMKKKVCILYMIHMIVNGFSFFVFKHQLCCVLCCFSYFHSLEFGGKSSLALMLESNNMKQTDVGK